MGTHALICKLQIEIQKEIKSYLFCSILESAVVRIEMEVVLQCENYVQVDALTRGKGTLGYFLGGYVPPGTPNWHPVLKKFFRNGPIQEPIKWAPGQFFIPRSRIRP